MSAYVSSAGASRKPDFQQGPGADPVAAAMTAAGNAATYDRWFKIADQDQDGRVTGPDAVL